MIRRRRLLRHLWQFPAFVAIIAVCVGVVIGAIALAGLLLKANLVLGLVVILGIVAVSLYVAVGRNLFDG